MKTSELLKVQSINTTTLRKDIFNIVRKGKPYVITNGEEKMFLLPYEDVVELIEIMEESRDDVLRAQIERARNEYKQGGGVPFEDK